MYVANWSVLITHWLTQNNCDSPVLELYSPSDIAVYKAGLKYASLSLTACLIILLVQFVSRTSKLFGLWVTKL